MDENSIPDGDAADKRVIAALQILKPEPFPFFADYAVVSRYQPIEKRNVVRRVATNRYFIVGEPEQLTF